MEPLCLRETKAHAAPKKTWALNGARGRKPNLIRSLLLVEGELEKHNLALQKKFAHMAENEVRYEERMAKGCDILLVAYGTSARIGKGAIDVARKEGIKVGMLRPISLWPFPAEHLAKLVKRVKGVLVVEMSSGQMVEDVRLAVNGDAPVSLLGRMGGGVPTVGDVLKEIRKINRKCRTAR